MNKEVEAISNKVLSLIKNTNPRYIFIVGRYLSLATKRIRSLTNNNVGEILLILNILNKAFYDKFGLFWYEKNPIIIDDNYIKKVNDFI